MSSKIFQNSAFTVACACAGTLARMFLARWIRHLWRRLRSNTTSAAPMRPAPPPLMTSSGSRRPRASRPRENPGPGAVALARTRLQAQKPGLSGRGEAPRDEHRFRRRAGMHLEVAAVSEEVVELDARQVPGLPRVELVADRPADPRHRRPRHR